MTEQAQTAARIQDLKAKYPDEAQWADVWWLLALVQQQAEEIAGLRQLEKCCHDPAQEAFNIVLARAEQAERRLAEQTGWRSMESAPKDGTEVLLLSLGIQNTGYMRHVASWRCITHAHISAPHHRCPTDDTCRMAWWAALAWVGGEQVGWMPLPPTPREKEEA